MSRRCTVRDHHPERPGIDEALVSGAPSKSRCSILPIVRLTVYGSGSRTLPRPVSPQCCDLRLALLLLLLRLREEDVIDGYVDFRYPQSHQVLDPPYNVAAHRFG
jgi:hypothetical protein